MLTRIELYLVGGLAVAIAGGAIYAKVYRDGVKAERARVEAQRARDIETAREIERAAGPCDRDSSCVLPDPFRVPDLRGNPGK